MTLYTSEERKTQNLFVAGELYDQESQVSLLSNIGIKDSFELGLCSLYPQVINLICIANLLIGIKALQPLKIKNHSPEPKIFVKTSFLSKKKTISITRYKKKIDEHIMGWL